MNLEVLKHVSNLTHGDASSRNSNSPKVLVKTRDLLNLILSEIKFDMLKVLLCAIWVVGFRNDGDSPLSGPTEEDLSG